MAKGKQKAADEAYHRAEAQRALVIVIDAAEFSLKGLDHDGAEPTIRSAIDTVRTHFLKVSEPAKVTTLAGQIDLVDGSVEGDDLEHESHTYTAPKFCPRCDGEMDVAFGGMWTPLHIEFDENGTPLPECTPMLQCGHCSYVRIVPFEVWREVREHRRRTIGAADVKPVKADRGKKTRGAG